MGIDKALTRYIFHKQYGNCFCEKNSVSNGFWLFFTNTTWTKYWYGHSKRVRRSCKWKRVK